MPRRLRAIWIVAVLPTLAAATLATAAPSDATTDAISQWIAELDSENYEAREAAGKKLAEVGLPAVEPLKQAAMNGNLEVTVRAVEALENIYRTAGKQYQAVQTRIIEQSAEDAAEAADKDDKDEDINDPSNLEQPFIRNLEEFGISVEPYSQSIDAAERALEEIAASTNRSAASRAARILGTNYKVRELRALGEITRLGGIVEPTRKNMPPNLGARGAIAAQDLAGGYFIRIGKNWTGGDDGVKHIERLTQLTVLYVIRGTPISEKALADLKLKLPNLTIQTRGDAYLGIRAQAAQFGNIGCMVEDAPVGGPAHRVGIRPGDTIISFDGKRINDFPSLLKIIEEHAPGDKIKAELIRDVQRGGQPVSLEITLDEWPELPQ